MTSSLKTSENHHCSCHHLRIGFLKHSPLSLLNDQNVYTLVVNIPHLSLGQSHLFRHVFNVKWSEDPPGCTCRWTWGPRGEKDHTWPLGTMTHGRCLGVQEMKTPVLFFNGLVKDDFSEHTYRRTALFFLRENRWFPVNVPFNAIHWIWCWCPFFLAIPSRIVFDSSVSLWKIFTQVGTNGKK